MLKHLRPLFLALLLALPLSVPFVLEGCTALGVAPAQTFNEKLAYAYGVHTAVLQAATAAVTAGTLSSADAVKILADTDTVKTALDAAGAAYAAGDAAGANSKLAIATSLLSAIQAYLQAHRGTTP